MLIARFSASNGNLSAHGSISSAVPSPAITASASLTQSRDQIEDCNPCQIMVGWQSISRVYWYNSSIGIPLDTVSVVVTKYNNTAITMSSTVYGDIDSINVRTVAEAQSIATSLGDSGHDNDYNLAVGVLLSNATEGASGTPAYPTPYLAIDGFQYVSLPLPFDDCSLAKRDIIYPCTCPTESIAVRWIEIGDQNYGDTWETISSASLTSTYYEVLKADPTRDLVGQMDNDFGTLNNESFLDFLSSASVFKSYPGLRSCAVFNGFNGPPQVIIPAFALTTTIAATVAGHGSYSPPTPQPASPVVPAPIVSQTAAGPQTVQTGLAASAPTPNPAPATYAPSPLEAPPSLPNVPASPGGPPTAPNPNPPEASQNLPNIPTSPEGPPAGESQAKAGQQPPSQGLNPILTFGGSTYTADESSNIVLSSQTLVPGSPAAVVADTPISIAPGGLAAVVGTSTQLLATLPSPAVLTLGGSAYTADVSSNIILAGTTLTAGGNSVVVSGTTVSLAPGGAAAVVGTSTQVLGSLTPAQSWSNQFQNAPDPVPAAPILSFGGSTYIANAASQFIVAGQTVAPGSVIKVSGTPISIAPGASLAVIGSSTQSLVGAAITPQPVLTFAGSTYTAGSSSEFLINGQTLTKGGTINVGGTQLSFGHVGTDVVIGTSTQQLLTPGVTTLAEPILTFDGSTYTAYLASDFVIDSQKLTRGGAITINGTPISYGQGGTDVVIGTNTQELSTASITVAEEPAITFDGSTYYADSASNFVVDGQTLTREAGGSEVVIGSSTEAVGLGGYIISGFGSGPLSTSPVAFTGKAARKSPTAGGVGCVLISVGTVLYVAV